MKTNNMLLEQRGNLKEKWKTKNISLPKQLQKYNRNIVERLKYDIINYVFPITIYIGHVTFASIISDIQYTVSSNIHLAIIYCTMYNIHTVQKTKYFILYSIQHRVFYSVATIRYVQYMAEYTPLSIMQTICCATSLYNIMYRLQHFEIMQHTVHYSVADTSCRQILCIMQHSVQHTIYCKNTVQYNVQNTKC